jgi:3-oxoacyl-[acyl-carrier-protein] synthase III
MRSRHASHRLIVPSHAAFETNETSETNARKSHSAIRSQLILHRPGAGASFIPLVLDEAMQEGRIKSNDLVVLSDFGAGLAWGTALMRW